MSGIVDCFPSGGDRLLRYRFLNSRSKALPFPESARFLVPNSGVLEEVLEIV